MMDATEKAIKLLEDLTPNKAVQDEVKEDEMALTDPLDSDFPCYIIVDVYPHKDGRPPTYIPQDLAFLKPGLNVDPHCFDLQTGKSFWESWETPKDDTSGADEAQETTETGSGNLTKVLDAAKVLTAFASSQIDQAIVEAKRHPDHGLTFYKEDILAALQSEDCYLCEVDVPDKEFVKVNSGGSTQTWKTPFMYINKPKKITKRVIQDLINRGANIRACLDAPLIWAAGNGDASLVNLFLKNGADPHALESQLFFNALSKEDHDVVKVFLSHGFDVHHAEDQPLWCAAEKGDVKGVDLMLKFGADVQAVNTSRYHDFGGSLIAAAAKGGNPLIFTKFLDAGADLNFSLSSALQTVAKTDNIEMLQHIVNEVKTREIKIAQTDVEDALEVAVYSGNVAAAKALVALLTLEFEGSRKRLSYPTQGSGLEHALKHQHVEMFDYLLATFTWFREDLAAALGEAICQENYDAMKALCKVGADPAFADYKLFGIAADHGNITAIRVMDKVLQARKTNKIPEGAGINTVKGSK